MIIIFNELNRSIVYELSVPRYWKKKRDVLEKKDVLEKEKGTLKFYKVKYFGTKFKSYRVFYHGMEGVCFITTHRHVCCEENFFLHLSVCHSLPHLSVPPLSVGLNSAGWYY